MTNPPSSPDPQPVVPKPTAPPGGPHADQPQAAEPQVSAEPQASEPQAAEPQATETGSAGSPTESPGGPPTVATNDWGRVDETGEVFVRTADGERSIGSWQVGQPEEALAFFIRKFDDLSVQVDLIEQRLESGAAGPDDTAAAVKKLRPSLADAHAIGDLDALSARLDAVEGRIAERRAERRAAREQAQGEARARKEAIAAEAEVLAEGEDWRNGADRLRALLDEWKSLARIDRPTDDALWRRFSTARTHYTRRRKAHFAEQAERRESAQAVKEKLIKEAETLAGSTDWGPTSRRYRELMSQWKAAGPAPRNVEDALWKRFRAAQDTFFGARSAQQEQRDTEQQSNLEAKQALLVEAEALVPVSNWKAARESLRAIQERWEAAGHVPRDAMRAVEGRLRKVEDAVRDAEQSEWQRSNPEARARARDTVDQLTSSIAALEKQAAAARDAGNDRKLREAEEAIVARRSWLEQAERALQEFADS